MDFSLLLSAFSFYSSCSDHRRSLPSGCLGVLLPSSSGFPRQWYKEAGPWGGMNCAGEGPLNGIRALLKAARGAPTVVPGELGRGVDPRPSTVG